MGPGKERSRARVSSISRKLHQGFLLASCVFGWFMSVFLPDTQFLPGITEDLPGSWPEEVSCGAQAPALPAGPGNRRLIALTFSTVRKFSSCCLMGYSCFKSPTEFSWQVNILSIVTNKIREKYVFHQNVIANKTSSPVLF